MLKIPPRHDVARLDVYILDYLRKRNLTALADSFQAEANVPERMLGERNSHLPTTLLPFLLLLFAFSPSFLSLCRSIISGSETPTPSAWFAAIDAPSGFLFEWWSVFWDIFIARTNPSYTSDAANIYVDVCSCASQCPPCACYCNSRHVPDATCNCAGSAGQVAEKPTAIPAPDARQRRAWGAHATP